MKRLYPLAIALFIFSFDDCYFRPRGKAGSLSQLSQWSRDVHLSRRHLGRR